METALAVLLKNTTMYVCEDSSYSPQQPLPANRLISLQAYILGCGMPVPQTLDALLDLELKLSRQTQVHPLGNLSGALSWPLAMPVQDQNTLVALMQSNTSGLPGLPLADGARGVLAYLMSGSSVSDADLQRPVLAMEKLLDAPRALALGPAIQARLGGVVADGAGSDYVMTAIQLGLDPESQATPARNTVAGFDLGALQHWGQPASVVVQRLGDHLLEKGRVSAKTAHFGASLLLARTAPQYLVRDIPASVTYGSVLWAQLAMAVARIEAQTPGRTLVMSYAEVLLGAEQLNTDEAVSEQINYEALWDWGAANGFLAKPEEAPSATAMARVREAYNRQLGSLKATSTLLQTAIPSRKAMALAQLEEAFPNLDPSLFEVRTLKKARLREGRPGLHPGVRSMLDIVMGGEKLAADDHWVSDDKRLPITAFCNLYEKGKLGVAASFEAAYDAAIRAHEEGHQNRVRQLICTLPLEDRKNLEFGKLEFFHTHQYKIAGDLFTPPALHVRGHTLEVKATRNGQVNLYTLDTRRGAIEKENVLLRRRTEPYTDDKMEARNANILSRTTLFEPGNDTDVQPFQEQPEGLEQPDSFNSSRSQAIADAFVKALDLKNDDLLNEARGSTVYDQESARNEAISQFFLNLIPLRSAIVNFQNGNVAQGIFDLGLDVVGLVTLGAGKAAQAGKVVGSALSSARHAVKAARFVGAAAVEAFNPVSGVGDLLVGTGRWVANGSRYVAANMARQLNQFRGATDSYELLKVASKQHGEVATGTFKVAGESVEGGAVLRDGNWYALDTHTLRAYGRPLEDFVPLARAVDGKMTQLPGELRNRSFREFKVPESRIAGLSHNSQGVYVAADGHLSHIRHTDSTGQAAVYEVRQVTRAENGKVQVRVYHNDRQTPLLLESLQADRWQRLGVWGGSPVSVKADLGPEIGRGGEAIVYASRDGKSVYKDLGPTRLTTAEGHTDMQVENLRKYYGNAFAEVVIEDGRKYIKMGRIDGVDLSQVPRGSLPPNTRSLVDEAVARMEAKDIYHDDLQLKNFIYSKKDNMVYPVDMNGMPAEFMVPVVKRAYDRQVNELRAAFSALIAREP